MHTPILIGIQPKRFKGRIDGYIVIAEGNSPLGSPPAQINDTICHLAASHYTVNLPSAGINLSVAVNYCD